MPLRAAEAETVFAALRAVAPDAATPDCVTQCEQALRLLADDAGSILWCEIQIKLGIFLLELREGDRTANVAQARAAYGAVLDRAGPASAVWAPAVCGYANCLASDPGAAAAEFGKALVQLEELIAQLRPAGDVDTLSVALGCYARTLTAAPTGDLDARIERAIDALHEEVRVLGSAAHYPQRWAAAHNNLANHYVMRRLGARSQNIDSAVRALSISLAARPLDTDPVGRARTLRNLASVLPEWSGADSQAAADAMAAACRVEAEAIARDDPRAAARTAAWGNLAGEASALDRDLDAYLALAKEMRIAQLEAAIANHRHVIARLSREQAPTQWADWMGGLGRLQAMLAHDKPEAIREAHANLYEAISTLSPSSRPRLQRSLLAAMGALGHQIGNWQISLSGYASALALSDALFEESAAPESRNRELSEMRGFALFSAYAAARLGQLGEAIRLAESGRARSMVEALAGAELMSAGASAGLRDTIDALTRRVVALEQALRTLAQNDPEAVAQTLNFKLADAFGIDPGVVRFRVTDPGQHTQDRTKDKIEIVADLRDARIALRTALAQARAEDPNGPVAQLEAADILAIAARAGRPIVYLMATVHGTAAVIACPVGRLDLHLAAEMTSDITRQAVHGAGQKTGFIRASLADDDTELRETLPGLLALVREQLMDPLADKLTELGYTRAVLVPLGSLALLPLHAARPDGTPSIAYAPSARALSLALARKEHAAHLPPSLLAIGDPRHDHTAPLPFAEAEARAVALIPAWAERTVLTRRDASLQNVSSVAKDATHLHLACHGLFRPASPMDSAILLAGDDAITLRMLLAGNVVLGVPRIAVLTACQSASIEFRALPDEVLGLPAGLMLAGVPGVVATMWPIDDQAAALFSLRFYDELLGGADDPAAAVAAAQRWLRDAPTHELRTRVKTMRAALANRIDGASSDLWLQLPTGPADARPFSGPEFWAAFVYIGI
jgi:CHAT domain-containing protein